MHTVLILMHVRTHSLNDPLPLESHLRPKIALLLGLRLRLFFYSYGNLPRLDMDPIFVFTL